MCRANFKFFILILTNVNLIADIIISSILWVRRLGHIELQNITQNDLLITLLNCCTLVPEPKIHTVILPHLSISPVHTALLTWGHRVSSRRPLPGQLLLSVHISANIRSSEKHSLTIMYQQVVPPLSHGIHSVLSQKLVLQAHSPFGVYQGNAYLCFSPVRGMMFSILGSPNRVLGTQQVINFSIYNRFKGS